MSKRKAFKKGKAIMEALTPDQAAGLLDTVLSEVDAKTRDQMLAKLDQDTARTTRRILSGGSIPRGAARSDGKVKSDWDDLWAKWYDIASEAGDEEGRYVEQDHDWEPCSIIGYNTTHELPSTQDCETVGSVGSWRPGWSPRRRRRGFSRSSAPGWTGSARTGRPSCRSRGCSCF